ncbi:MAG: conjugative relaxase [Rhodospirillaceae bacterium]|nr:conjugative relaxase [Rhodospirillaceae bacterium]
MVASIGAVASASQGVSYYERDGYYASDDPAHREASAWAGRGAEALGLSGQVDPGVFKAVLEGRVPDGSRQRLGRRRNGNIVHRPGRDLTLSAPKSVSLAALVGGDERILAAHEKAVKRTLGWVEEHVAETRLRDPQTGRMVRAGGQAMVAATFTHDTSRNLDPQLHTHAVLANMLKGGDGKWRTMANEKLYASQKLIGAIYRGELAREVKKLGYGIEKTHADGRFEIAGVSRKVVEAFSTRRAAIVAAMNERGLGDPESNPRLAERAALMTRAHKRDVDHDGLRAHWEKQAEALGFHAKALSHDALSRDALARAAVAETALSSPVLAGSGKESGVQAASAPDGTEMTKTNGAGPSLGVAQDAASGVGREAMAWAVAHLSEREAVFSRTDLLAAALAWKPGAVTVGEAQRALGEFVNEGSVHAANHPVPGESLTTDKAVADERETIALMTGGQGRGKAPMRARRVDKLLRNGPLTEGQKAAVKLILSEKDRVVGVQGYAGTGKTRMLNRARALLEKKGYELKGLAPSASAAQTLEAEANIETETLQRFLLRNDGVAKGRLTKKGASAMREAFRNTVLVVDEGSLASTVQARNLLRIAREIRLPKVILVGDGKQLDAVDAGKPFVQLQQAGMKTATMDRIMRQKDEVLREAVEASLKGDIKKAFEKLGTNIEEVKPDNLAGAAAARWLKLSPEERERAGLMAPSHKLRVAINDIVRERLIRDSGVTGKGIDTERLVSKGYTNAQKALAGNYAKGDVVGFHRQYKRLGIDKGDELRVLGVDQDAGAVSLERGDGTAAEWIPRRVAARTGGVEVYRSENLELRQGDRIRWTRNDYSLGLVNSQTADVTKVEKDTVTFRLEDGGTLELKKGDSQLRHIDRAWASTVHAFQGRTVDAVIAAMEAEHPHLTTQKSFYVEISRARHRAELVTDDRKALGEHLESATGERVAALESLEPAPDAEQPREPGTVLERPDGADRGMERTPDPAPDIEMEWTGPDLEL